MLKVAKAITDRNVNFILEENFCQISFCNSEFDVEFSDVGDGSLAIAGTGIDQVIIRKNGVIIRPIPVKRFKHICDSENSGRFEYTIDENVELQISYTIKSEESFLKCSFVVTLKQNDKTTIAKLTLDVESEKE